MRRCMLIWDHVARLKLLDQLVIDMQYYIKLSHHEARRGQQRAKNLVFLFVVVVVCAVVVADLHQP